MWSHRGKTINIIPFVTDTSSQPHSRTLFFISPPHMPISATHPGKHTLFFSLVVLVFMGLYFSSRQFEKWNEQIKTCLPDVYTGCKMFCNEQKYYVMWTRMTWTLHSCATNRWHMFTCRLSCHSPGLVNNQAESQHVEIWKMWLHGEIYSESLFKLKLRHWRTKFYKFSRHDTAHKLSGYC